MQQNVQMISEMMITRLCDYSMSNQSKNILNVLEVYQAVGHNP